MFICFSHSDDNILRNIELFDKLSLRFSERILFIKDVLVSNEICLWSFFGNAQKIIDVDCTSIVYGQDKKHTKVWYFLGFFVAVSGFSSVHVLVLHATAIKMLNGSIFLGKQFLQCVQ